MFRRYPHPMFRRQALDHAVAQDEQRTNKERFPGEMRAGADAEAQAAGLHPQPGLRLAQAYVPWQRYGRVFSPPEALEKGTLFPELYSPYPY